nr:hypothetical protein [Methylomarinum sp. Ch1-1]MDP4520815.1 hypothetical protein [Methylomarinum sp. Ch1-1]
MMPMTADNTLQQKARTEANAGHYQEAIALYKKLLQQGDNEDCHRQLAHCYLQRAKSFAGREMIREALVLWENHARHSPPPYQAFDRYLLWLILSNNQTKLQQRVKQLTAQQLDRDYPELAAVLGLLILTRLPRLQQALPEDSVFTSHLNRVQLALQARDLDGMLEALQQLPYRSAFRDLRSLVKACKTASHSPAEARSLLNRIPPHSPYANSAKLLQICGYHGAVLARQLANLDSHRRQLLGDVIGLKSEQLKLLDALCKQADKLNDKAKFTLALQFQSLFGAELTQRYCLAMLPRYPAGLKPYQKHFGTIDDYQHHRLKALTYEREHRHQAAESHWRNCIDLLRHNPDGNSDLKIALILRHMAENQEGPELASQLRMESLEYDPNDRNCLLEIVRYYGQSKETADRQKAWLTKALAKFPEDIELLTLAIEAAIHHKAYKKTVHYANRILQIDPLNRFAQQTLLNGHLNHARKLLKNNKYSLADQEIRQAEALKGGKSKTLETQLLRALLCFADGDQTQGLQLLAETLTKLHSDPVNMHFQVVVEAQLCGLPMATLSQALPTAKDYRLSAKELSRLNQQLRQYGALPGRRTLLCKALEKIKEPVKKSLTQLDANEDLLLSLCQTLETIGHFELLRFCSECAPEPSANPIWVYYQIFADSQGDPTRCDAMQAHRLTVNLDKAKAEKTCAPGR